MICPKCGKQLSDNAAMCKKCGEVFKVNSNNTETLDYINKEKEKSLKRAEKLQQKQKEQKVKQSKKENRKPVNKKAVASIIIAFVLAAGVAVALLIYFDVISLPGETKDPALSIEYTAQQVSDEDTVMKLGDISISQAEYSFFFHQSYSNTQNNTQLQFKDYMSNKLGEKYSESENYYEDYFEEFLKENPNSFDFAKPINSQTTKALDAESGEEISWLEYIRNDAIKTMTGYRVKYALAQQAGLKLTDDIRYQVYEHIEGLRTAVLGGGYQSLDQYLKILFGEDCDEEFFKNELIREYTASKYDTFINQEYMYSFSDEDIKKDYDSDYKDYDYTDLYVWEATGADAKQKAEEIAKQATDENKFIQAVASVSGSSSERTSYPVVPKYYIDETFSEQAGEWAFDRARKAGETSVFKTKNGYAAVFVQTPSYTQSDCFSYREIVINKTDENGAALAGEELEALTKKVDDIYKKVRRGNEDTFAYYAISASQGATATSGGLSPCAFKKDVSTQIGEWAFDESRKEGDISLLESPESYTIVYFVKNIGDYWNYAVRNSKAVEKAETELEKANNETYALKTDDAIRDESEELIIKEINTVYLGMN